MDNIYIGRQPIFDNKLNVIAYELLFRSGDNTAANVVDGDSATTNVIINAMTEIGMEQLVGSHRAFINLTRNHIIQMSQMPLPEMKQRLVLEILEDIEADDDVVEAVKKLAGDGFSIALDDFIYKESLQPLVDISDIIKIDLMAISREELAEHVDKLKNGKRKMLAEKVETQEEYDLCKSLGFDYFQGYFFSKPNVVTSKSLPANKLAILKLITKLHSAESGAEELAQIITQDVTLSMRILKYINSASFALNRKVDSIKQAIMMLGIKTIRNLANLVAMSTIENKAHELLIISMIRARMSENIARLINADSDAAFTAGLFSIIDTLMDRDMETVIKDLPLSDNITFALLKREGILGDILNCATAYESGNWKEARHKQLTTNDIRECYLDALNWASQSEFLLKQ